MFTMMLGSYVRDWTTKPEPLRAADARALSSAPGLETLRDALPADARKPFDDLLVALANWTCHA